MNACMDKETVEALVPKQEVAEHHEHWQDLVLAAVLGLVPAILSAMETEDRVASVLITSSALMI